MTLVVVFSIGLQTNCFLNDALNAFLTVLMYKN